MSDLNACFRARTCAGGSATMPRGAASCSGDGTVILTCPSPGCRKTWLSTSSLNWEVDLAAHLETHAASCPELFKNSNLVRKWCCPGYCSRHVNFASATKLARHLREKHADTVARPAPSSGAAHTQGQFEPPTAGPGEGRANRGLR